MAELRFAMFGAHFWAQYQLAAWHEFPDAKCVALYNRTVSKAEKLAREFGVPAVYGDAEELLAKEKLDFVDICTDMSTHYLFTEMVARHKLPVICQKAMSPSLAVSQQMVNVCHQAGVPFYVHENWRWQHAIRAFKDVLDGGSIGVPFRARLSMVSGYPVFINEPALKDVEEFILWDMGTHMLDVARFLFGEADRLYCQVHQIHRNIRGEDIATVMMHMGGKTSVICELGYAENYLEHDHFVQTMIFVEGDKGSAELAPDYWVRVTTKDGTHARRWPPPYYKWVDPDYLPVHSSIVPCIGNLLGALKGECIGETTGDDNLKTIILTSAAYDSARSRRTIDLISAEKVASA